MKLRQNDYSEGQVVSGLVARNLVNTEDGAAALAATVGGIEDALLYRMQGSVKFSEKIMPIAEAILSAVRATANSRKAKEDSARAAITLALFGPALLDGLDGLDCLLDDSWSGEQKDVVEEPAIAERIYQRAKT